MKEVIKHINGENIGIILFFIGVYGITARKNILKTIISLGIIQAAAILFFVSLNSSPEGVPPIGKGIPGITADPLPQALMITAVVIGVSVTAVSLTMFVALYHKYGTTNWDKIKAKREEME